MKYFLLLFLLSLPVMGANVTWRTAATGMAVKVPSSPTGGGYIYSKVLVNGVNVGSASVATPVASGQNATINVSAQTRTADENASVRLILYYDPNASGAPNVDVAWLQFSKSQPPVNPGGPFDPGGNPTTPNGDPVDDQGNPVAPPPKRYHAAASWHNGYNFPATVTETWTTNTTPMDIIKIFSTNVPPGTTYNTEGWNSEPFTIRLAKTADGAPLEDDTVSEGEPVDESDPPPGTPPLPPDGSPGGPGGPPLGGGGIEVSPIDAPPAVTPEPRPGNTEGNAEARHKELMSAVNRAVQAAVNNGNQAKQDAAQSNSLLGSIKDNTGKTANNTEGIGDGEGSGNGTGGALNLTGAGPGPGNEPYVDPGWTGKLQTLRTSAGNLLTSAQGLGTALGLGAQTPGQVPLRWQFNVPHFGTVTLDLDALMGGLVEFVRSLFLFYFSIVFVFRLLEEIQAVFA